MSVAFILPRWRRPRCAKLIRMMQDPKVPYAVRPSAVRDLRDRVGLAVAHQVACQAEVTVKHWESKFLGAVVDVGGHAKAFRQAQIARGVALGSDPNVIDAEIVEDVSCNAESDTEQRRAEAHKARTMAPDRQSNGLTPRTTRSTLQPRKPRR